MSETANGPESIGERLRRLRLERNLSQRELASPGVSYAYISRIEAGARRPSVKALRQLARKLAVSVEYLETGSDLRDVDERELKLSDAELELRLGQSTEETERVLNGIHDEAVAAGDTKSALRANVALGLAVARAGRSADAIQRLEPAIESLSPTQRPDVYEALGRCYAALGDPKRAVDLFARCLEAVRREAPDDTASEIRFSTYLSYALADVGDLDQASSVLEDALARSDEMTDAYTRVRLYWSLARLSALRDQPAAALDYIRRAIALLEVTEDTLHLAPGRAGSGLGGARGCTRAAGERRGRRDVPESRGPARATRPSDQPHRDVPSVVPLSAQHRPRIGCARRPGPGGTTQRLDKVAVPDLIEASLRARGPYSLRLSTRLGSDATRHSRRSACGLRDRGRTRDRRGAAAPRRHPARPRAERRGDRACPLHARNRRRPL